LLTNHHIIQQHKFTVELDDKVPQIDSNSH